MKTIITTKSSVIKAKSKAQKSPFFSPSNVAFFNSRLASQEAYSIDGRYFWFVTSERKDSDSERKYTIRVCDDFSGEVSTFGDFQAYNCLKTAIQVIKDCI